MSSPPGASAATGMGGSSTAAATATPLATASQTPSYPTRSPLGSRMSGSSQQGPAAWKSGSPNLPRQTFTTQTTQSTSRTYNSPSPFMGGGNLMTSTIAQPSSYSQTVTTRGNTYVTGDSTPVYAKTTSSTPMMMSSQTPMMMQGSMVQGQSGNSYYMTRSTGGYYGQKQTGGSTTVVGYGESHVISERIVEHEVRVPKRVVREDIVEKVMIVPEKVVHEEVVDDVQMIRERIVEVAKPIYQERIVEVPEIEYVEKIVEVPEIIYQEKVREIPRIEIQERITEVPKIITQERVVEVPEIEYLEVPYEKIIEVPEIREQVVLKQVPVPQYVERPVPEYVNVDVYRDVERRIPVPIELVTTLELKLPRLRPRYTKHDIPLYVPRFIEIPLPAELMDASTIASAEHYARQVAVVASHSAASLCEIERLAGTLKELDGHYSSMMIQASESISTSITSAWQKAAFELIDEIPTQVRKYVPPAAPADESDLQKEAEVNVRSPTLDAEEPRSEEAIRQEGGEISVGNRKMDNQDEGKEPEESAPTEEEAAELIFYRGAPADQQKSDSKVGAEEGEAGDAIPVTTTTSDVAGEGSHEVGEEEVEEEEEKREAENETAERTAEVEANANESEEYEMPEEEGQQ